MDKIDPNLKKRDPPLADEPGIDEGDDPLIGAIAASLPEFERWSPSAAVSGPRIGHGVRVPDQRERAEGICKSIAARPTPDYDRVRRALATISELLVAYLVTGPGSHDEKSERAVCDLVDRAERFTEARRAAHEAAVASVLMTELPQVYEHVARGELGPSEQTREVMDLVKRVGIVPKSAEDLEALVDELVVSAEFVAEENRDPGVDGFRKLRGPVETAAYTVEAALNMLGVRWPHKHGVLIKARQLSDRDRLLGLSRVPFGAAVGVTEVIGFVQRALQTDEDGTPLRPRGTTEL